MLIDLFLGYLKNERNYSETTFPNYGADLREFQRFFQKVDKGLDWCNVDSDVVRMWIMHLMDAQSRGKALDPVTVNRKLSSLRSFFRFLLIQGKIKINPMAKVKGPKKKKVVPIFLKESEMEALLDGLCFEDGFVGCRDKTILDVFYSAGVRLAELVGLNDVDVDFENSTLKVTGKRNKQRIIPFGEELREMLLLYIKVRNSEIPLRDSKALFLNVKGGRISQGLVYKIVRNNLSKVTSVKKRSPHVLRHTFATVMLNHSANIEAVKELLGHSSLAATEVYTHATFEELKQIYNQAHPRA